MHAPPQFRFDPKESLTPDGYLTPVYFNKEVLVRYSYDSRFSCEFHSDTYGTVFGSEFDIEFGVNSNGSVVAWLGDLEKLPLAERYVWLAENKEPEANAASEFFEGQINAEFTEEPSALRCLNALERLNNGFHQKFSDFLYHERSIEARIEEARRYKRMILDSVDDFKRFVTELNEIINERINNSQLRKFLDARSLAYADGAKGNKLLEVVYRGVLGDSSNLIAPFYYLYDIRLWAAHNMSDEKLTEVARKLGKAPVANSDLWEALVAELERSSNRLHGLVEALT